LINFLIFALALWVTYVRPEGQGYPRLDTTTIKGKKHCTIVFATRVLPCFTYWHNLFYVDKKKIIPLDLYNLLDYEALAY